MSSSSKLLLTLALSLFIIGSMVQSAPLGARLQMETTKGTQVLDFNVINRTLGPDDSKATPYIWGDYSFERRIRPGSYGRLWRGTQISTGKEVVLKMNVAGNPMSLTVTEVNMMKQVNDAPNMVKFVEVLEGKNERSRTTYVIVMEYFRGEEFIHHIDNMNAEQVRTVMYECLRTIDYVNSKGIYHLDINPGNIMLNITTLQVGVIDWGLAKFYPNGPPILPLNKGNDVNDLGFYLLYMILGTVGHKFQENDAMVLEYKARVENGVVDRTEFIENGFLRKSNPWDEYVAKYNLGSIDPKVWDLLDRMLTKDRRFLMSAKEAMEHSYFQSTPVAQPVREVVIPEHDKKVIFHEPSNNLILIIGLVVVSTVLTYIIFRQANRCLKGYKTLHKGEIDSASRISNISDYRINVGKAFDEENDDEYEDEEGETQDEDEYEFEEEAEEVTDRHRTIDMPKAGYL